MTKLTEMPNIGATLAQKLQKAGINSPQDLIGAGTKEAFLRLKTMDNGACFNMLCALEGAIRGIRWHDLDETVKADLKRFYQAIK
ncbi:MAG: TfoX/Sxy family protein [Firmicutes bacterium]|nr:TfoX/Sxy family protein [Bacillota bacterium]